MVTNAETCGSDGTLTSAQIAQFHRDGYLLLPSFFDPTALLAHSKHLISSFSDHQVKNVKTSIGGLLRMVSGLGELAGARAHDRN